eukprot:ANDGO_00928.mRNA.1 Formate--tetrahydrofolate ligase
MDITKTIRTCTAARPVPSDIDISQSVKPLSVSEIAGACGILDSEFLPSGKYKGKIDLAISERLKNLPLGKYVYVTGCTPTPLGEGKSTTTVGLAQALGAHLKVNSFACIRQPSLGPVFGVKGSAAGGGYAQVIPMEDFTLGIPDIHSVSAANNLLAAAIDTRMFHEATQTDDQLFKRLAVDGTFCPIMKRRLAKLGIQKENPAELTPEEVKRFVRLDINPDTITWNRVVDINDRMMRKIQIGLGSQEKGHTRNTGFDIAVASECMAVLALSTSITDMRERLGRIVIGMSKSGEPVTAEDIGCAGAMTVLLRDALMPNLMQTVEGTPVMVHAGPFANIAHGNNSIVADDIALRLVGEDGIVVTEAGFAADMGLEKGLDIKCRISGHKPSAVVIVATCRALKHHGGVPVEQAKKPNVDALLVGCANLTRHIENIRLFGLPVCVAINRFVSDTDEEIEALRKKAMDAGAYAAVECTHWADGGLGAVELAKQVVNATKLKDTNFRFLYDLDLSLKQKIETIATKIYRADGVEYTEQAEKQLALFEKSGFGKLPICMAKTAYSFSADPDKKNAPTGFKITVRDVRASVGAGFVYPLLGEIATMPGLTTRPGYYDIDVDEKGNVVGMF